MKKLKMSQPTKKIAGIMAVVLFVLLTIVIFIFVGKPLIEFVSEPEKFRDWVDAKGIVSRIAFVGMIILQIIVAIIPGEPFEIGAGYAFGTLEGTVLCIIGSAIGSMTVFLFVRFFGMRLVTLFFSSEKIKKLKFLQSTKKKNALFFIIYMIPGTPKDILCYYAGLTDIKLPVWLLICTVGKIPSVITSTVSGNALGMKNYVFAAVAFGVTMIISLGGLLAYSYIGKKHEMRKEKLKEDDFSENNLDKKDY